MDSKSLEFGQPAREKMVSGVVKLAKAVKATLGPRGRNVVIQKRVGTPHITKDGVTVARAISFKDPHEESGAQMVKEVAQKTADVAGDGTTTGTVLAEAIATEGLKLVAARHDPMSLKRGIDKAVEKVVEQIIAQRKEVSTTAEVRQVATISANGDDTIGSMVAEAIDKVGKDGIITLEEGKGTESTLRVASGFEFDRGYLSPYFCNEVERQRVILQDARVLLVNGKLSGSGALKDMQNVLEECHANSVPIVIIAEAIEGEILNTLIVNAYKGALRCVAIKAPGFGDARKEMLGDLAALTGAAMRDGDIVGVGQSAVKNLDVTELGFTPRIEVYKDRTLLLANPACDELVEQRAAQIRAKMTQVDSSHDLDNLEKRLAKLTGGAAVIEVGAATEAEMKERKDRLEDALAATRAAIQEGIVPGGGVALVRAASALKGFSTGNPEEDAGVRIVLDAITVPLKQIAENAGQSGDVVVSDVRDRSTGSQGFDAYRLKMVDMFEAGIVDPTKVTRVALQNAASIAGLMLTTECVIVFDQDDSKKS